MFINMTMTEMTVRMNLMKTNFLFLMLTCFLRHMKGISFQTMTPDDCSFETLEDNEGCIFDCYKQGWLELDVKKCPLLFTLRNDKLRSQGIYHFTELEFGADIRSEKTVVTLCYREIKSRMWKLKLGRQPSSDSSSANLLEKQVLLLDKVRLFGDQTQTKQESLFVDTTISIAHSAEKLCRFLEFNISDCDFFKWQFYNLQTFVDIGPLFPLREYYRLLYSGLYPDYGGQQSIFQCTQRLRYILSHHKTGSSVSWKLSQAINSNLCKSCYVEMLSGITPGYSLKDGSVVHLIRNPWDTIISGYMYHLKSEEYWLSIPLSSAYQVTVDEAVRSQPQNDIASLTAVHEYISQHQHIFPLVKDLSYREYLNVVSAKQGVKLEYVRAIYSTLYEMIRDIATLEDQGRVTEVNNVCLSSLMNAEGGNGWEEIKRFVLEHLDIPLSNTDEYLLKRSFFSAENEEERLNHATEKGALRVELYRELKVFDFADQNQGIVHQLEEAINCPSEIDH